MQSGVKRKRSSVASAYECVSGFYILGILPWQERRSEIHNQRTEREKEEFLGQNPTWKNCHFRCTVGRERERERGGFIKTHWFPRTKTPLYITHQPPLSSFPRLLLSLSIIHALFSATSWQVRKITENEEQRKRPIKQKRKERGAINTFFIYFPFFFFVLVLFWCWGVFDLWVLSASEGLESFDYNKPFLLK